MGGFLHTHVVLCDVQSMFCNGIKSQIECQLSDKWLCRWTRFELQASQNGSHDLTGISFSLSHFSGLEIQFPSSFHLVLLLL
jgi:hypothetical protein